MRTCRQSKERRSNCRRSNYRWNIGIGSNYRRKKLTPEQFRQEDIFVPEAIIAGAIVA